MERNEHICKLVGKLAAHKRNKGNKLAGYLSSIVSPGLEISSSPLLLLFFSSLQNWLGDGLVLKGLEQGDLVQGLLVQMVTIRNSAVDDGGIS